MKLETYAWTATGMRRDDTQFGPTLYVRAHEAEAALAAKQAEIDRLTLEHCPQAMTKDQIVRWAKHQVAVEQKG